MAGRKATATHEDWAAAAHRLLIEQGPQVVTVEGVARVLGVTKGSFYWHFESRSQLLAAALERWEREQTRALIEHADAASSEPLPRLQALFHRVAIGNTTLRGENAIYSRAADSDPQVQAAVERITHARLAYVSRLLRRLGLTRQQADDRARIALSIVLGQRQLVLAVPALGLSGRPRERVTELVLQMITQP